MSLPEGTCSTLTSSSAGTILLAAVVALATLSHRRGSMEEAVEQAQLPTAQEA